MSCSTSRLSGTAGDVEGAQISLVDDFDRGEDLE